MGLFSNDCNMFSGGMFGNAILSSILYQSRSTVIRWVTVLLFVFDDFCTLLESLSISCRQLSFCGDVRKTIWKNNNFWHCGQRLLKMYFFDEKCLIFHGKSCKKLSLKPLTFFSESSIMIKSGEWKCERFSVLLETCKKQQFPEDCPISDILPHYNACKFTQPCV